MASYDPMRRSGGAFVQNSRVYTASPPVHQTSNREFQGQGAAFIQSTAPQRAFSQTVLDRVFARGTSTQEAYSSPSRTRVTERVGVTQAYSPLDRVPSAAAEYSYEARRSPVREVRLESDEHSLDKSMLKEYKAEPVRVEYSSPQRVASFSSRGFGTPLTSHWTSAFKHQAVEPLKSYQADPYVSRNRESRARPVLLNERTTYHRETSGQSRSELLTRSIIDRVFGGSGRLVRQAAQTQVYHEPKRAGRDYSSQNLAFNTRVQATEEEDVLRRERERQRAGTTSYTQELVYGGLSSGLSQALQEVASVKSAKSYTRETVPLSPLEIERNLRMGAPANSEFGLETLQNFRAKRDHIDLETRSNDGARIKHFGTMDEEEMEFRSEAGIVGYQMSEERRKEIRGKETRNEEEEAIAKIMAKYGSEYKPTSTGEVYSRETLPHIQVVPPQREATEEREPAPSGSATLQVPHEEREFERKDHIPIAQEVRKLQVGVSPNGELSREAHEVKEAKEARRSHGQGVSSSGTEHLKVEVHGSRGGNISIDEMIKRSIEKGRLAMSAN